MPQISHNFLPINSCSYKNIPNGILDYAYNYFIPTVLFGGKGQSSALVDSVIL